MLTKALVCTSRLGLCSLKAANPCAASAVGAGTNGSTSYDCNAAHTGKCRHAVAYCLSTSNSYSGLFCASASAARHQPKTSNNTAADAAGGPGITALWRVFAGTRSSSAATISAIVRFFLQCRGGFGHPGWQRRCSDTANKQECLRKLFVQCPRCHGRDQLGRAFLVFLVLGRCTAISIKAGISV